MANSSTGSSTLRNGVGPRATVSSPARWAASAIMAVPIACPPGTARDASGEVDGSSEVVALPYDDRPVVESSPRLRKRVDRIAGFEHLLDRADPRQSLGRGDHDGVTDRLDELASDSFNGFASSFYERVDEVNGSPVTVDLGQRGEPGEVDERDRALLAHVDITLR